MRVPVAILATNLTLDRDRCSREMPAVRAWPAPTAC